MASDYSSQNGTPEREALIGRDHDLVVGQKAAAEIVGEGVFAVTAKRMGEEAVDEDSGVKNSHLCALLVFPQPHEVPIGQMLGVKPVYEDLNWDIG